MSKMAQQSACAISAITFRRIYLLNVISNFPKGVFGKKRLQKVVYLSQRSPDIVKLYDYKRHYYGQYSETVEEIKEQLLTMGFIHAIPLDTSHKFSLIIDGKEVFESEERGNRYIISDVCNIGYYAELIKASFPDLFNSTKQMIHEYGFMQEEELIKYCYSLPEFQDKGEGETLFESNIPEWITMPELSQDECDELELTFTPSFIAAMKDIFEAAESATLDLTKVKQFEKPL